MVTKKIINKIMAMTVTSHNNVDNENDGNNRDGEIPQQRRQ